MLLIKASYTKQDMLLFTTQIFTGQNLEFSAIVKAWPSYSLKVNTTMILNAVLQLACKLWHGGGAGVALWPGTGVLACLWTGTGALAWHQRGTA